jgi:putative ABC transport system permease protein
VKALYAALLWLLPAGFRRRYRAELLEAFDEERRRARLAGPAHTARFIGAIFGDLIRSAARQRTARIASAVGGRSGGGAPALPRDSRRTFMDALVQDVRYACRTLLRRPGFTAVAVLSMALGIGGNTLIYGIVDGLVLHPFSYPDPDRLVAVGVTFPKLSSETTYIEALSPAEYADIRPARSFSTIAAFDLGNRNVSGGDVPERVFTALLLDDLFPVLGMKPALGRGFTADELAPAAGGGARERVAILSHRLWQSRFGGDPAIVGRAIRIGGVATTVVGVMPPGLVLVGTDLWIPWGGDPSRVPRNARQFNILARLAPGVSEREANAELALIAARVANVSAGEFKEYEGWRLTARPWAAALLQEVRPAAFMLLGAVGFVLLIACANLANLLLARATTRQRELAVRLALGAERWRLARHLLTESLLLGLAGAAVGLLVTHFGLKSASSLVPAQFQMLGLQASLNGRVLAWSLGLTVLASTLVGLLPALQATRADAHDALKSDGRAGAGRAGGRLRQGLVVAEIALAVALLLGAGLLTRSFLNIQRMDPGFDPRGVLTMRLTLPQDRYRDGEAVTAFFEELTRRVTNLPGVRSAAMASQFPPLGPFSSQVEVDGGTPPDGATLPTTNVTVASRDLFRTLGIPVLRGRDFTGAERAADARHVVVNLAFVERYLPGREAIGARIRPAGRGSPGPWAEIVGVVGNARNGGVSAPARPEVFIAMEQGRDSWNQLFLLVRSESDRAVALLPAVRAAVASLDAEQPVYAIQTLEEALATSSFQTRVSTLLLGLFAAVALVLAAVGIFGVMSYAVSARTQEIGVRLAIGAQRQDVVWLVLRQVLTLSAAGIAIGIALLLAAGRAIAGLLYGVGPSDPVTIVIVAGLLAGVAVLAGWVPAWRASRVDPISALRYE